MLVAVIVPNPETVNRWANDFGFTKPFEKLCSISELQEHILLELKSTAEKHKVCLMLSKTIILLEISLNNTTII